MIPKGLEAKVTRVARGSHMSFEPRLQPGPVETSGGHPKDRSLGLVHRGFEPQAIEAKESGHGGVPETPVAVDKG